jgi:hypothetical protein
MKKIPLTVYMDLPETLEEAIKIYGMDRVYKDYMAMLQIVTVQKMRAAGKIVMVP